MVDLLRRVFSFFGEDDDLVDALLGVNVCGLCSVSLEEAGGEVGLIWAIQVRFL